MAHNTYIPRRKDWKTILNERIDLYKEVSRSGDTTKADFILLRDQLAHEDHYRTITEGPFGGQNEKAFKDTEDLHKLHALANGGVTKLGSMSHDVHQSMSNLQASGEKRRPAWIKHLDDEIDKQEERSRAMWEDMRKGAHDTIAAMSEEDRDGATNLFISALGAVVGFATKVINWLKKAVASIVEWLKQVWQKILEFGKSIANWFTSAWHAVQILFGGDKKTNFAILASEPAVHVPTDSGEGCRNRTSSDGRHVDDHSHPHAGGDGRHSGRATSE